MRKILWLASWYPNETEPFNGDFIKRQAEAVSIFQPLIIIFAGKKLSGTMYNKPDSESAIKNLQEFILYYPDAGTGIISKIRSLCYYFRKHLEIITKLRENNELPNLVHVQVAMKSGLIALYLKWKYKIPYVLSEHWSGYYEESDDSLFRKSFLDKYLTRRILKTASRLLPVSNALGNQISHYWAQVPFQAIPNVVNTRFFYSTPIISEKIFRFIHVSSLQHPKNPEGIIRAFQALLHQGIQAELVLVGPLNPELLEFIKNSKGLNNKLHCVGEISYEQVGYELRKSQALVLFSYYETMSCVIIEALCTGIPVIASRVGGVPELIQQENGILISAGKETELTEAMKEIIRNYRNYNRTGISQRASDQFSYETVGKEIIHVYESVLNEK